MSEPVLVEKRFFRAPPERVYHAWTDAEIMAKWFYAGADWHARVQSNPRPGGTYHIEMISPEGEVHAQHGIYRELRPYDLIVFTWSNDLVEDSVVSINLAPTEGGTELTLNHYLPDDEQIVAMHRQGWAACLGNLASLFSPPG